MNTTATQIANSVVWKNKFHLKQQRRHWLRSAWNSIAWLAVSGACVGLLWFIVR